MSSKLPDRKTIIPVKSVFPRDGRFPTKRNKNDNRALLTTPAGFGELMRRHKFRSDFELSLAYKLSEYHINLRLKITRRIFGFLITIFLLKQKGSSMLQIEQNIS